ncbi:uncharacterized protein LOC143232198 [Tachypleus tridentatus]|uniref:uncharacterized protein LOC143232198 n=1 Tax=Tachypleus tridentatus TaxID=6853 RepID=UPI003FD0316F
MLFAAFFLGLLACSQAGLLGGYYGAGVVAPAYAASYGGPDPTGAFARAQGAAANHEGAILRGIPVGRAAAHNTAVNHGGFGLGHGFALGGLGYGYGLGGLSHGYGLGGLGYGYGLGGYGYGLGLGYGYGLGGYGYGLGLGKGLLH